MTRVENSSMPINKVPVNKTWNSNKYIPFIHQADNSSCCVCSHQNIQKMHLITTQISSIDSPKNLTSNSITTFAEKWLSIEALNNDLKSDIDRERERDLPRSSGEVLIDWNHIQCGESFTILHEVALFAFSHTAPSPHVSHWKLFISHTQWRMTCWRINWEDYSCVKSRWNWTLFENGTNSSLRGSGKWMWNWAA